MTKTIDEMALLLQESATPVATEQYVADEIAEIPTLPTGTKGDILIHDTQWKGLPIGATGKILKVNSGGDGVEWSDPPSSGVTSVSGLSGALTVGSSGKTIKITAAGNDINLETAGGGGGAHNMLSSTHTDTTPDSIARGDILTGQGSTPTLARLAKGTTYNVLKMGAEEPEWGQLDLTRSVNNTLPVANGGTGLNTGGTTGQILTWGLSSPMWAAVNSTIWHSIVVLSADRATTSGSNAAVDVTDFSFSFAANSIYIIDIFAMIQSATATTGFMFNWDTSVAITNACIMGFHQLATSGTLTAFSSVADNTFYAQSSGTPGTVMIPMKASGLLVTSSSAGTAQLKMKPEAALTTVITMKKYSVMRVQKVA